MANEMYLYKVKAEGCNNTEYSAAYNQADAIRNITDGYPEIVPDQCSVTYVGVVTVTNNQNK